jgi:LruC domain-containing protein
VSSQIFKENMKLSVLTISSLLLLASCQKPGVESSDVSSPSANPETMQDMKVSRQFDYETSKDIVASFVVESQQSEPVLGIRIEILDKHPDAGGVVLYSGQTQADGSFETRLALPSYLMEVFVRANLIGAVNEAIVEVKNGQLNHKFGGPQDQAGKTARSNKTAAGFTRIPHSGKFYFMGTFNSQGVPDYLEPVDDVIDAAFMTDVSQALPERKPLDLSLIDPAYDHDVIVDDLTDLWLTFVHEAAGYKNTLAFYKYTLGNEPATANDIDSIFIVFPNTSYTGSGGGLNSGNKVYLGRYPAGTRIGWVLLANAWKGGATQVKTNSTTFYSNADFNTHVSNPLLRQHHVPLEDISREHILLGFEDIARDNPRSDKDFNDCLYYLKAQVVTATDNTVIPTTDDAAAADTDGDGVVNYLDDYPQDALRAFNNHSYGILAYEDLWPAEGDYDFNDLVADYTMNVITNAANDAVEITMDYVFKAVGAGYENGFAIQFDNLTPADIASVSGYSVTGSLMSISANGTEGGQSQAVIPIADKMSDIMRPAGGAFVNTIVGNPYVSPDTVSMSIMLSAPIDPVILGAAPFNPFLMSNQDRGREVHLADHNPTDLATVARFGTAHDDSDPGTGRFYKTELNLPWALHLSGAGTFR